MAKAQTPAFPLRQHATDLYGHFGVWTPAMLCSLAVRLLASKVSSIALSFVLACTRQAAAEVQICLCSQLL